MSLDDRMAGAFGDEDPGHFGSGWMSGTASVFLGALGLGAVACFHFPELFTTPDVRANLPISFIRVLVQLVIGLAFLLGLVSAMLRRRKVLGMTGMVLALTASLAGGGSVEIDRAVGDTPMHLGLDWFLLNVLIVTRGLTFVPLFLLGFDTGPLYAYLVFVSIHAVFIHANVSWTFPRWVEAVVVTPRFHHWHHGVEREAIDKNFAVHLPWLDKLFGTYYAPEGRWPAGYGIEGNPVPDGYLAQLTYPAQRKREAPEVEPQR